MQELGVDITSNKTGDWRLAEVDWLRLCRLCRISSQKP